MPTVNPVGDVAVCSGGTVSQISFGTTVTSPAVTYSWTADANCSLVGLASSGTGNIGAFTANANTGTSAISTTITVTPKIGDCTGTTENFTITVYPSLTAGAIGADQTICYNTVPAPFSSLTPAGGGSSTPAYLWQYSTDGIIWTDIDGAASEEYAPATALTVTSQYRRRATNDCGTVDTDPVTVTVRPELPLNYPDIRIRICPYAGKSVNLSKYLDTLSLTSIKWESVSPNVQIDDIVAGTVLMDRLKAPTVYTFNYTVGNPCSADIKRKIYLEVLKPGGMRPLMDTVAVCHEYAEALQINQLFGIEARGSWSYAADGNITSYITESHSTTHDGAVIINGKAIYGDSSISTVNYHGVAAKRVTVTYTTASDSCLAGKPYTITIILTPDIMK
jgi:hypothetical protein